MCVVHIANRLPSTILNKQTPCEILHKTPPNYKHLKAFGCVGMASNPCRVKEFNAIGVPCVFLGYPHTQRGFKLLNLTINLKFVSRDMKSTKASFVISCFVKLLKRNLVGKSEDATRLERDIELRSSRAYETPTWHQDYITSSSCTSGPVKIQNTVETTISGAFSCSLFQTHKQSEHTGFKEAIKRPK